MTTATDPDLTVIERLDFATPCMFTVPGTNQKVPCPHSATWMLTLQNHPCIGDDRRPLGVSHHAICQSHCDDVMTASDNGHCVGCNVTVTMRDHVIRLEPLRP